MKFNGDHTYKSDWGGRVRKSPSMYERGGSESAFERHKSLN